MTVTRRYGKPGFTTFPYLFSTLRNEYIVYASNFTEALMVYKQHHTYDPWSVRQMSDNE